MKYQASLKSGAALNAGLISIFCLSLFTLHEVLMGWVWVLCACSIAIALIRLKRKLAGVKNLTLNLLAIFCMALLIFLSKDFGLMATMVNLLVVAGCLKLINLQSQADYHTLLIIQFFLIASGLILHQNIYMVSLYFVCIVFLFATAFLLNKGNLSVGLSYKQSIKMLLQAIPIAIALFVVVPRLPPFWQANVDTSAQTGLSETLTPGDIADLAQSDDLVFRAQFSADIPQPQQRYWRSIVLDHFDGRTWSIGRASTVFDSTEQDLITGPSYRYLIMAEPNDTRWLYALDVANVEENMSAGSIFMNQQYQLYKNDINSSPSLYILRSFYTAKLNVFVPQIDFAKYLQLPDNTNPRTDKWVKEQISNDMSFSQKLAILNSIFTANEFVYTLKPPIMPNQPIDRFLFDNQEGFCSHYASALTYMLRVANIPARMVAGYQGGDIEAEKILSIRQYDAHAWVEAFDPVQGWVRFDPTALVAPNRTLAGLLSALSSQETERLSHEFSSLFDASIFEGLRETFAIVDFNWNTFVLGFNQESQVSLIETLFGELSRKSLTTFLLYAIAAIAIFVALLFLPYKKWLRHTPTPILHKVLKKLEQCGYKREKHESLQTFYERIKPKLKPIVQQTLAEFIAYYYQDQYQQSQVNGNNELKAHLQRIGKQVLSLKKSDYRSL